MKIKTVDVGNTAVDICEYENGELKFLGKFTHKEEIRETLKDGDKIIVCSVRPSLNEFLRRVGKNLEFITVKEINMASEYESMETLGTDRLLFAYGVKKLYSRDALLVSAGTSLVVDLMIEGTFKGGFITCGLSTKARALSERAEQLPLIEPKIFKKDIGRDTISAMEGGIYLESLHFIISLKEKYESLFKKTIPIYITGGEGMYFEELGFYDPLILHKAMIEWERER